MIAYTCLTQFSLPSSWVFWFYSNKPRSVSFRWDLHCQSNKLAACSARVSQSPAGQSREVPGCKSRASLRPTGNLASTSSPLTAARGHYSVKGTCEGRIGRPVHRCRQAWHASLGRAQALPLAEYACAAWVCPFGGRRPVSVCVCYTIGNLDSKDCIEEETCTQPIDNTQGPCSIFKEEQQINVLVAGCGRTWFF